MNIKLSILLISLLTLGACGQEEPEKTPSSMQLTALRVGTVSILSQSETTPNNQPIIISFNAAIDRRTVEQAITLINEDAESVPLIFSYLDNDKTISASPEASLEIDKDFTIRISDAIKGAAGEVFSGIEISFTTSNPPIVVTGTKIGEKLIDENSRIQNIDLKPTIDIAFSEPVSVGEISDYLSLNLGGAKVSTTTSQLMDSVIRVQVDNDLQGLRRYNFLISSGFGSEKERPFDGYQFPFYTKLDSTLKFPEISDEELLTKVQEQTFKYFWDFGHPVSGLTRERNTSNETVTIGGSGFGVMAIIVGIERGFITHQEGIDRLDKIITFLGNKADRFHGVWSHWLNGTSGQVVPFSANDDGGDLVETAFMIQGLMTVRQYLDVSNSQEASMIEKINTLIDEVEWDWYTQNDQDVLYWHWSPNFGWAKNHRITGWNEAMIVYVMAAASTTHSIDKEVYQSGWSRDGAMVNSNNTSHYGYMLPLRTDRGGPLFFAHYSFLGLDPRNLSDQFANYWTQNVTHSLINQAYCIANPQRYVGYADYCWGLTASDGDSGYSAHSPDNDRGVITPTAALSSIPYTPEESMKAMRHFYFILGDRLWGEYGFYDAFNPTENWYASSYLAIDQGPIILMIENYRTGLLWGLFMSAPEVQSGLENLEITYE